MINDSQNNNSKIEEKDKDNDSLISKSIKSNNKDKKEKKEEINIEENLEDVFSQFIKIKNCSIISYGVKPSTEKLKFGYCLTCDINL